MKYFVYFCVLAALLSWALAESVTQELQSAGQAMIESEGPADVEQAVALFLRQEEHEDVEHVESDSRQKRVACRCYRRGKVIVCYCR
ncbi:uncharacterized protein LOC6560491 [Drosophila grimshawi]|uniref:GH20246 n=1 Tax=Drosophila grimshawi TaxID=7222 RepID=B4J5N6_DROGR|nr:uncharacterized protein LOC6560491 [Drosophila grimshawi]EDW01812.1 GH20246 [Drosophila grimshawi]